MPDTPARTQIKSAPCPNCRMCGSVGEPLYASQSDRLFGAAGVWTLKRCSGNRCGLVWLDPMPVPEDIGKAYEKYYTHDAGSGSAANGMLKRLYLRAKNGYLAARYGYQTDANSLLDKALGMALWLFPLRRSGVDEEVRFIPAMPQGRLLDVGCGSGEWMLRMSQFGWRVSGVDFDENALRAARSKGLDVRCGAIESARFPDRSFDVVTLNHVIEHVPDPVATLVECARVLKEGGRLVIATPNSSSFGHQVFRQHWRGLEPPRHLHIFDPNSMAALLRQAGFAKTSIRTCNSEYVWRLSFQLWAGHPEGALHRATNRIGACLLALFEQCLLIPRSDAGECLAVEAIRTSSQTHA